MTASRSVGRLLALLVLGLASVAVADTIKLKDGSLLEGDVIGETETNISIEVQLAHGTISQTKVVDKGDVVEVTRLTEAQKRQRALDRDYEQLQKYILNTNSSSAVEYYDRVISGVFRKFLTNYPDSSYEQEINERIAEWQAEREKVAGGQVKYQGRWQPAGQVTQLIQADRDRQALERARTLLTNGQFTLASQQARALAGGGHAPELIEEARKLALDVDRLWLGDLQHRRDKAFKAVDSSRQLVTQAQAAKQRADASYNEAVARRNAHSGKLGEESQLAQADSRRKQAESDLRDAQDALSRREGEMSAIARQLAEVQSRVSAAARGSTSPTGTVAKITAPTPATALSVRKETDDGADFLRQVGTFFQQYWWVGLGVVVVILWMISRAFGK